jgi:hypothetical protein
MKMNWMLGRRLLLCAFGLSLVVVAGPAKTARAATCPKGSCVTNADCSAAHCQIYTGYPAAGICAFHCCFCPE